MDELRIRPAAEADLPRINDIYNHYVLHSTATYQETPETPEGRRAWFERHGPAHPVLVAQRGAEVVGWASLSRYHTRSAYRRSIESSVYVRHDLHRQGIGSALLRELIEGARAAEHHAIIAAIDADQHGSIALHARFGFEHAGRLREIGFKFGRWLDVVYMQYLLPV